MPGHMTRGKILADFIRRTGLDRKLSRRCLQLNMWDANYAEQWVKENIRALKKLVECEEVSREEGEWVWLVGGMREGGREEEDEIEWEEEGGGGG